MRYRAFKLDFFGTAEPARNPGSIGAVPNNRFRPKTGQNRNRFEPVYNTAAWSRLSDAPSSHCANEEKEAEQQQQQKQQRQQQACTSQSGEGGANGRRMWRSDMLALDAAAASHPRTQSRPAIDEQAVRRRQAENNDGHDEAATTTNEEQKQQATTLDGGRCWRCFLLHRRCLCGLLGAAARPLPPRSPLLLSSIARRRVGAGS